MNTMYPFWNRIYIAVFHQWWLLWIIVYYSNNHSHKMGVTLAFHIPSIQFTSTTTTTTPSTTSLYLMNTNENNNNFNSVFPISTRQALLERSKQINQGITVTDDEVSTGSNSSTGSNLSSTGSNRYTTTSAGWSNRAATVLTPVHIDPVGVYTADRPFYWNTIDVGCRATIIEIPSSTDRPDLFVHSPVNLDGPMIQCLQQIGNVRYICSTNYEHVKFAAVWYQNYGTSASTTTPADMWACPGLQKRMPEIPWKGEIPHGYRPISWQNKNSNDNTAPPLPSDPVGIWDTSILQPLHINIEHNPFTQRPFFNEVIFYHTPTKTLLCTDLFWNYPSANGIPNGQYGQNHTWALAPRMNQIPLGSQMWKFGMDQIYYPFFNTFMITDASEYKRIAHHILHVWDVETVIPAHGDILRGKELIRSILTKYFQLDP